MQQNAARTNDTFLARVREAIQRKTERAEALEAADRLNVYQDGFTLGRVRVSFDGAGAVIQVQPAGRKSRYYRGDEPMLPQRVATELFPGS